MTTPTAAGMKRCPGFDPEGGDYHQPAHELPADLEHFNSSKGSKDDLSTRCRACGNAYGKAWSAAKKAGIPFGRAAKAGDPAPAERKLDGHPDDPAVRNGPLRALSEADLPKDDEVETPEGQRRLKQAADTAAQARRDADARRKREARAAAKAASPA